MRRALALNAQGKADVFYTHIMPFRLTQSHYLFMSLSSDVFIPTFVFDDVTYVVYRLKRKSVFFFLIFFFSISDKCYLKVAHSGNISMIKILGNFKVIVHKVNIFCNCTVSSSEPYATEADLFHHSPTSVLTTHYILHVSVTTRIIHPFHFVNNSRVLLFLFVT